MLDQLHCGGSEDHSVRRRCSVGGSRRGRGTMSAVGVACLITTFMLSVFFPASVVARTGPGIPASAETISYLGRTPVPAASAHAEQLEAAELITQSTERTDLRVAPQDVDSIINFHRKKGSNNRRGLVGSSPPTCKAKCGVCQPCKPVHVAIGSPHGVISETEYYPEVWRCQCGNRYYMP